MFSGSCLPRRFTTAERSQKVPSIGAVKVKAACVGGIEATCCQVRPRSLEAYKTSSRNSARRDSWMLTGILKLRWFVISGSFGLWPSANHTHANAQELAAIAISTSKCRADAAHGPNPPLVQPWGHHRAIWPYNSGCNGSIDCASALLEDFRKLHRIS